MKSLSIVGALALSLVAATYGGSGATAQDGQNGAGPGTATDAAQTTYSASGDVTSIAGDRVTTAQGPVEGLGWPAMTMTFQAVEPTVLQGISAGDRVAFQFRQSGNNYPLTALSKVR